MKMSVSLLLTALAIAGLGGAPAFADTDLIGEVASNTAPAFTELAAAYAKLHPGTTIRILPAGSKTISDNVNRGLASDFIVIGEPFIAATQNLIAPGRILINHTVIVVAPGAKGKIAKPADLAASGIRVGSGSAGSTTEGFTNQTLTNLAAQLGSGYPGKVQANITLRRADNAQLVDALKSDKIDAAILFAADAKNGDLEAIDVGSSSVSFNDDAAILKNSTHVAQAKDFLAFARSPEGQAIIRKHGHDF